MSSGAQYLPGLGEGPVRQWHGIYYGYIAVNADPLAKGRVKLRVPQVFGNTTSGWATPMVPLTYIPPVGTAVTVMFIGGDPTQPVWFGNFALVDAASGIVFSPTAPINPTLGEVWVNTTNGLMSEWNGVGWVAYQIGTGAIADGTTIHLPNITGGTITGAQFIGTGGGNELLLYNGAPGLDGLTATVTTGAASDGHGNVVPRGFTLFDNIAIPAGGGTEYWAVNLGTRFGAGTNSAALSFGFNTTGQNIAFVPMAWVALNDAQTLDITAPYMQLTTTAGSLGISGSATMPVIITTDSWHPMTLINGWTVSGSGFAQYKLMPDNTVMVRFGGLTPGTTTDATTIWTPPTGYIPSFAGTMSFTIAVTYTTAPTSVGSTPEVVIRNTPAMQVYNLRGTVGSIAGTFSYPLD